MLEVAQEKRLKCEMRHGKTKEKQEGKSRERDGGETRQECSIGCLG